MGGVTLGVASVVRLQPDGKRDKDLNISSEAVQKSLERDMLTEAISKNVDRELGEGNCGGRLQSNR